MGMSPYRHRCCGHGGRAALSHTAGSRGQRYGPVPPAAVLMMVASSLGRGMRTRVRPSICVRPMRRGIFGIRSQERCPDAGTTAATSSVPAMWRVLWGGQPTRRARRGNGRQAVQDPCCLWQHLLSRPPTRRGCRVRGPGPSRPGRSKAVASTMRGGRTCSPHHGPCMPPWTRAARLMGGRWSASAVNGCPRRVRSLEGVGRCC